MILSELTRQLGGTLVGDGNLEIRGVASLEEAGRHEISFLMDPRYASLVAPSGAGAILVPEDYDPAGDHALLRVSDVAASLDEILTLFAPPPDTPEIGVHPTAVVADDATIGRDVAIGPHAVVGKEARIGDRSILGPGCVIGRGVQVGAGCRLGAHVVVEQGCRLGDRVIVHANSTLGTDGFGYRTAEGRHHKVPQIGIVEIEDDVEIGSNTCVDRAKCGRTVIGEGTKIDNLVQIGHNVQTGKHCIMCAQTGVSGSTTVGNYVVFGGQCGIVGHLNIGDGVQAGAQSGVTKSVEPGMRVVGFPAREFNQYYRELAQTRKVPTLARKLQALQTRLDELAELVGKEQPS